MDIMEKYFHFKENSKTEQYLYDELESIENNKEAITDRFYKDLSFGTGGLRGEMGAGTNRLNIFTVGKATKGLADYLNANYENPSVCIAYDTRHFSKTFSKVAAEVFCAEGIHTYLFEDVRPTPMLSFATRFLKASAGIVLTASHNPKQYNGYKVYGDDGGQITDNQANSILEKINSTDMFTDVRRMNFDEACESGTLKIIGEDIDEPYYKNVKSLVMREELMKSSAGDLKILYTPLHGTGNIPIRRVLSELGFSNVSVVKEQEKPDGDFPTCEFPNPEYEEVFDIAKEIAKENDMDLIFGTDPDCDRIGVLVKDKDNNFSVLTGNQIGALLCDYIIKTNIELGTMPKNPAIIKTIVTSDMGKAICEKHGVTIKETLTGFKYIGEMVSDWEDTNEHSFLLGFEESYGYLAGSFVKDKDAVIAAVLITEMTLYHRSTGKSLFEAMQSLYEEYGFYEEELTSFTMKGMQGQDEISNIMSDVRKNYIDIFSDLPLVRIEDYKVGIAKDMNNKEGKLLLPKSNVLKFILANGSWIVLRPSGTEPKIKFYISANGETREDCKKALQDLEKIRDTIML